MTVLVSLRAAGTEVVRLSSSVRRDRREAVGGGVGGGVGYGPRAAFCTGKESAV